MFRMSQSELRIRVILAICLLLAGISLVKARQTALANAGSPPAAQPAVSLQLILQKEKASAIQATPPQDFNAASGQLQIVEFYKPGDPSSEYTAQLMRTFQDRYRGQVTFTFLDVIDPRNASTMESLHDLFSPQFVLLDGKGHILNEWISTSDDAMSGAIGDAMLGQPTW